MRAMNRALISLTLAASLSAGCQSPGDTHEELRFDRESSAEQLVRFMAMEGNWRIVGGDESQGASHNYKTIANGTVVVETAFPGQPHEMITVFHLDGPKLVMTHYCAAGNQPYMVAEHPSGDRVHFRFERASDMVHPDAPHMRDASYHFIDRDRVNTTWQYWEDGAKVSEMNIELERVPE